MRGIDFTGLFVALFILGFLAALSLVGFVFLIRWLFW